MLKEVIRAVFNFLTRLLSKIIGIFGYELMTVIKKKRVGVREGSLNLNIGAGEYVIDGFTSLDFYSEHYYKNKQKFLEERVEYNIRTDALPFSDNSVDNIYISHVVEHVEDKYVEYLLSEAYRVLKVSGVIRIACPDAKFLFEVSQFKNDYWSWRHKTISNKEEYSVDWDSIDQLDFLIREIATPRFRFGKDRIDELVLNPSDIENISYEEFINKLSNVLTFRSTSPNHHINLWDFERLKKLGVLAGFSQILESKQFGSISAEMQSLKFDKTAPHMSLYVEMVK